MQDSISAALREPDRANIIQLYLSSGYELFALKRASKEPLHRGWRDEVCGEATFKKLAATGHNLGVRLKPEQAVVDVDPRNAGEGGLEGQLFFLKRLGLDTEDCPQVVTGSGDYHF